MKGKKEKTEYGTVRAILPKSKKARYGAVEPTPEYKESEETEGTEKPFDLNEAIHKLMDAMEKMEPSSSTPTGESGDGSDESKNDDSEGEGDGSDESKNDDSEGEGDGDDGDDEEKENDAENEPKENELLSELLRRQLQIRALGEISGADRVSQLGVAYRSFIYCASEEVAVAEIRIIQTPPATVVSSLVTGTFPYFKEQERAEVFLELCGGLMKEYSMLVTHHLTNAQEEAIKPIKVINS